jgi:hypothetical protein
MAPRLIQINTPAGSMRFLPIVPHRGTSVTVALCELPQQAVPGLFRPLARAAEGRRWVKQHYNPETAAAPAQDAARRADQYERGELPPALRPSGARTADKGQD